jgi:hypothetical protein
VKSYTQVLIAFFSAMAVTLVAVSDMRRSSPGALATVHQRVPELAGRNDCSECHGGLLGTLQEACLACHEPIEAQLADGHGLHGTLGARSEQCGLCHAEHHGANAPLVHGQSFALAGVPKADAFDHRLVGFVLDGAHAPLECGECHVNARAAILPAGETRFLGLERDCASCHEDPHEGRMRSACASCHGQETWDGLSSLEHERFLPLVGPHALACTECHAPEDAHALEIVGGKGERPAARECATCHESPHRSPFVAGVAVAAGLAPGQVCGTCHAAEHVTFHEPGLTAMSPEQHALSGFALAPPHDAPACADCHTADPTGPASARARPGDFAARYPGRAPAQCSACHADVHEGQFETGPFAGAECDACHDPLRFEPHAFGAEEHGRTALELTGKHLEAACEECHAKASPDSARAFRGTSAECDACHADAHAAFFEPVTELLAEVEHGECARCHDAESFAGAAADFEHETFTGFAVLGAHAQSECTSCHVPAAGPDATGRTFGRVEAHFGAFTGCVSCHADPHGGLFEEETGSPAEVEGSTDCARCHVESSFRALRREFDHGSWTGFALAGAHAAASCAACHPPLPGPSDEGRTSAVAAGASCSDCHEDPHARQFADEFGVTDCARCHVSEADDFLDFDHETDARFALGQAHAALACDACHATEQRSALAFVRFRPLGRECTDCHGSNAEVLLRRQPRKR